MFMQRFDFLFERRAEQKAPMIASFGVLQQAIAEAMQARILKQGNPETASNVIWAVMHGIASLAIADAKRFNKAAVKQSLELAMDMIINGLRQR
jgi:hypothetical protein